jgi:putative beta-lysine N-acetyltransferase
MFDRIERVNHSLIQHGPNNDRIYLIKLDQRDLPGITDRLDDLSIAKRYTKIFAKVPEACLNAFLEKDYRKEATIPGMKNGAEDIHFVSKFFGSRRSFISPSDRRQLNKKMHKVLEKKNSAAKFSLPEGIQIRQLQQSDAEDLASLYQRVFKTYPFPIFEPAYLSKTMEEHIRYFGAFESDRLVAASSAEMDLEMSNAEMTDFATVPEFLGKNLSYFLLEAMEAQMRELEMKTLYTIARAESVGMNTTFARMDYKFAGTLLNNTMISGKIESMHVWYKPVVYP